MRQHQKYPRLELHPDFRNAVYADPRGVTRLAPLVCWNAYHRLSTVLNARRVPATPKNVERLRTLAALVGYPGEVFRANPTIWLSLRGAAQHAKLSRATICGR